MARRGRWIKQVTFQNFEEVHRVHHLFFIPDSVMNNFQPNHTNHIPFSPSLHAGHGYGNGLVQKLIYKEIHSRIVLSHKLWIKISTRLLHGNAWFKHQNALRSKIYWIHMAIATIRRFENLTFLKYIVKSLLVLFQFVKTDVVLCSRRWLMMKIQLKGARGSGNLQLPLESDALQQLELAMILASNASNRTLESPAHEESTKNLPQYWWIIDEMMKKVNVKNVKIERILWVFGLDLKKWLSPLQFCYN